MKKEAGQRANNPFSGWLFLLILLLLLSVLCLGLFLFNLGQIEGGSTFFPVSLRSVLSANYNADAQSFNVGVVDLGLIESALSDQGSPGPSIPGLILTPVPTITPYTPRPSTTNAGTFPSGLKTPTRQAETQIVGPGTPSSTQPGGTLLGTTTPTMTITPTPTRLTLTVTPTPAGGRTPTPFPTLTVRPSNSATRPGPTSTATNHPPSITLTNTFTARPPTTTFVPTATTGGYPPPPVVTSTPVPGTPGYP